MLRHAMKDKSIDGWNLTSWRPFRRYNTGEYAISSIFGSSGCGWLTLFAISRKIRCKPRILESLVPNSFFDNVKNFDYQLK